MTEILNGNSEKTKTPEELKMLSEVKNLLESHSKVLEEDLNKLDRGETAFYEHVSTSINRGPVAEIPYDPTYKDAERSWLEVRSEVQQKTRANEGVQEKSTVILDKYYHAVVPKILQIINSDNRADSETALLDLVGNYDNLQKTLEKMFSDKHLARSRVVSTLENKSEETSRKNYRLRDNCNDRRIINYWENTSISTLSRRLRKSSEESRELAGILGRDQRNISHYDSFTVSKERMSNLLVAFIEKKYGESTP